MNKLASAIALGIGSAVGTSAFAADAIHDWTGISAGVEGGIDHARSKWNGDFSSTASSGTTLSKSSGTGSAFAGYTLQSGNLTYGAEVDYGFFAGSKSAQIDGGEGLVTSIESKAKSLGSARVKLGYASGDTLFYVTGGVAFGDFNNVLATNGGLSESASKHVGWAGGLGADYALDAHLAVRLEGMYYGFGSKTFDGTDVSVKNSAYTIRVGVVYKF
jgi:opacity protein-like surface antigen